MSEYNQTVAFIGLGNMGGPMAANLARAGVRVRGFDVSEQARHEAAAQGIEITDTVVEASEGAQVVITMLPNGALVKSVIDEILAAQPDPRLYIDSSTIAVSEARDIAHKLEEVGSRFIDAPVSGGVRGSVAGTLAFMVGGPAEAYQEATPLLEIMGSSLTHCGQAGNGQAVKACNNMILAVQQIVLAEALVLGERLGLDHQAFFDVVSHATGNSWSLSVNAPVPKVVPSSPANHDFRPGFSAALMLKDLKLAMTSASETQTDVTLGRMAAEIYEKYVADGHGDLDFSAIINEVRGD
ncbi:3-hydroxyisobutyrate dehydrogenase [Corynebacterium poyangense]|uniref:3-hydroxyisobutyrate dehydrogenase n=1 Tax=Corynebacterium poyangense TaxID=2684405 RepID=A0A7H0SL64_9CORY|nr:3-hydroxyisobutyrate dehydrogenase [Corynebacterium poyangense]MBZ8177376.1 3-hydroxyisobutyrate dehydrogenase [Corynebacterium poyangense]QNQ89289.1 3-hydroxyisobutyrate dehydrogenase [Corynebacterium poyangense]